MVLSKMLPLTVAVLAQICPLLVTESAAVFAQEPLAVRSIQWNSDGSRLAVGYKNGEVDILNPETNEIEKTLQIASSDVYANALAWTLDGSQLATGDNTGRVIIWDTENWQPIVTLTEADGGISLLTWNADETNLIGFTFGEHEFMRWDVVSDFRLIETDENQAPMQVIAWNLNHTQAIAGIQTGGYILYDPITFSLTNYANEAFLTALAWSPDGSLIATGNLGGTVKMWDSTRLQAISTLKQGAQKPSDIQFPVTTTQAVAFSADSEQLYALQGDGTLLTWNTTSYELLNTQQVSASPIVTAQFSPDGTKLAYAGETEGVEIMDVIDHDSR